MPLISTKFMCMCVHFLAY